MVRSLDSIGDDGTFARFQTIDGAGRERGIRDISVHSDQESYDMTSLRASGSVLQ